MFNEKIGIPIKFYRHPSELDKDTTLSAYEKVIALENWLDDIKLKLIAEDESMGCTLNSPTYFTGEILSLLAKYDA
ncbi:MAG: hypothetical protein H0U75_02400 [Legionella sp.]|nr:hypothetical protein [Legionella sp.]